MTRPFEFRDPPPPDPDGDAIINMAAFAIIILLALLFYFSCTDESEAGDYIGGRYTVRDARVTGVAIMLCEGGACTTLTPWRYPDGYPNAYVPSGVVGRVDTFMVSVTQGRAIRGVLIAVPFIDELIGEQSNRARFETFVSDAITADSAAWMRPDSSGYALAWRDTILVNMHGDTVGVRSVRLAEIWTDGGLFDRLGRMAAAPHAPGDAQAAVLGTVRAVQLKNRKRALEIGPLWALGGRFYDAAGRDVTDSVATARADTTL